MKTLGIRIGEIFTEFWVATASDKKLTTWEIKRLEIERNKAVKAIIKITTEL